MVLPFCTAVDPERRWGDLCMFIHIAKVCTNKMIYINTSYIPICPFYISLFLFLFLVPLLYNFLWNSIVSLSYENSIPEYLWIHFILSYGPIIIWHFSAHRNLSRWVRVLSIEWLLCVTAIKAPQKSCFEFVSQKLLDNRDPSLMYEIFSKKGQKNIKFLNNNYDKKKKLDLHCFLSIFLSKYA